MTVALRLLVSGRQSGRNTLVRLLRDRWATADASTPVAAAAFAPHKQDCWVRRFPPIPQKKAEWMGHGSFSVDPGAWPVINEQLILPIATSAARKRATIFP
jgi:hypothetical protein